MRVIDIAKRLNISSDTVRYYTRIGILRPKSKDDNGYRVFTESEVKRLNFTVRAKRLGFSLKDIKEILSLSEEGKVPCPIARKIIKTQITRIKKELDENIALFQRMEQAASSWDEMPDQSVTGETICHLIENWDTPTPPETSTNRSDTT